VTSKPLDVFSRPLRDLRISVTDRCNFRCVYCMPKEVFGRDFQFLERAELLSFEEICRLARIFVDLGVEKIRLTGGEPLVRKDVERLVAGLSRIPGLKDIALTTNGSMLAVKSEALAEAGLRRVTVSLDALDDATFRAMNDTGFPVARVLSGIEAAHKAGLGPIKINMVVKRGVNDDQVLPMAEYFRYSPYVLRFIEYMDVGTTNGWRLDDVLPADAILSTLQQKWELEPLKADRPGEVATRYRYQDGRGEIGIISSVSRPFCSTCVRARLSAKGELYTCLFGAAGHDLRSLVRDGSSDADLREHIAQIWGRRVDRYSEIRASNTQARKRVEMSYIGG
jgi:cyclic pyranopterin phosphate synthase